MARHPYTPLFKDILASSIWSEPPETRIVWISMLAMMDADGYVGGSISGLARINGLTPQQVQEAIECLENSDPESRSDEHEGRRIEKVDRGWMVLNAVKMRELAKKEAERHRKATWARKQYAKKKGDKLSDHYRRQAELDSE